MITTLITLLFIALFLYLIYYFVGKLMPGTPHQIVGIILGLVFLLYALKAFNLVSL